MLPDPALAFAMLERLPVPVCLRDAESRYVWCNRAWLTAAQRPREMVIGSTDAELLPRAEALRERERDQRVLQSRRGLHLDELGSPAPGLTKFATP